jgi:TetR/AcrR family transcriptional repressor of nem operon
MRYPKDHKKQVRKQLLLDSGSHAKVHGFAASGVDALAGAAGLTTGSLYKHFDNKDALFSALITAELDKTKRRYDGVEAGDFLAMQKILIGYLSMSHVRDAASGCPVPSLAAEVARSSDEIKRAFEMGIFELKNAVTDITGSSSAAWTLMAQNVGAVMIARAMLHESAKREILAAVRTAGADLLSAAQSAH